MCVNLESGATALPAICIFFNFFHIVRTPGSPSPLCVKKPPRYALLLRHITMKRTLWVATCRAAGGSFEFHQREENREAKPNKPADVPPRRS